MIRSSEFWGGMFWLSLGVFVIWAGRDLGLGRVNDPGSGFALFWIGLIVVGIAASVVFSSLRAPGPELSSLWADTRWGKVLFVVGLLVAYGLLFERIGFIPCTLALLLSLMLFVDPVQWWLALLISCGAVFGIWAALTKALKIQLPMGLLEPWLT